MKDEINPKFHLGWWEKQELGIEICPRCGSRDTWPNVAWVGLAYCEECKYSGNYMEFRVSGEES